MDQVSLPPRALYAAAIEALTGRIVRALTGSDDAFRLGEGLVDDDELAGLAAVRVLGPDVLTPYTVGASRLNTQDAEVLVAAFTAFPGTDHPVASVPAWRDWATAQWLNNLGVDRAISDSVATYSAGSTTYEDPWAGWSDTQMSWQDWSSLLAQLAPLATPGMGSPVHQRALNRMLDTARGATRAVLRGDHLTAAQLARWLVAILGLTPGPGVLTVAPLLRHLELIGGGDLKMQLHIAVARAAIPTGPLDESR